MVNLVKAKDSSYIHAVINFQVITVITYDCRALGIRFSLIFQGCIELVRYLKVWPNGVSHCTKSK